MKTLKTSQFHILFLPLVLAAFFVAQGAAQDSAPDVGPSQPHPLEPMESHVDNVVGHAKDAKMPYRRYCAGCHGDLGDGNGENAVWLDPKPRDFTTATFKCRSTPTGYTRWRSTISWRAAATAIRRSRTTRRRCHPATRRACPTR